MLIPARLKLSLKTFSCKTPAANTYTTCNVLILKKYNMTAAAKSVFYFGFYLYATGLALIFIPNQFLTTFQLPETNEVWIRVVGVLVVLIGFYYHQMGKQNYAAFYPLTVIARTAVCVAFISFALLKFVSPMIIPFGVVDLLGAIWTSMALKKGS